MTHPTLATGTSWYKGATPYWEITQIEFLSAFGGMCDETWDASAEQDGSITCYRKGNKIYLVCNPITEIGEKNFAKFYALKKITGLSAVTTIGACAFGYTPVLSTIDIDPGKLTSIGESAFRMSSAEDALDLSGVSLDIVGNMATRHKRWSNAGLAAVRSVEFPESVYMEVPHPDAQCNYPDVLFGTKNGEACYVDRSGCAAFACYHAWNALHADAGTAYNNWLDWYNTTLNADGKFAENNEFDGNVLPRLASKLGWSVGEHILVGGSDQLQTVLDTLKKRQPVYVAMPSLSIANTSHAVIIVGCDPNTRRLAIVDSNGSGPTVASISWLAFEDIFAEDTSDLSVFDSIRLFEFNFPVLAPNSTWFSQGKTSIKRASITEIDIVDSYTPTGDEAASWDASAALDKSIMAYANGTVLTVAGNGSGRICANSDSSFLFSDIALSDYFSALVRINGGRLLETSKATTFRNMFKSAASLAFVDVSNWSTGNVTTFYALFNGANKIDNLNVAGWDTSNVEDFTAVFNNCWALTGVDVSNWRTGKVKAMNSTFQRCENLLSLDLSGWDTSECTTMISMFNKCYALKTVGNVSKLDVRKATTLSAMFQYCQSLETLDLSGWDVSQIPNLSHMFAVCVSLKSVDLSGWNNSACTTMDSMFYQNYALEKLAVGSNFRFVGNNARPPAPSSQYIPDANGMWYDIEKVAYAPADIPDGAGTYFATPGIADKTGDEMMFVSQGSLLKAAKAIREKTGSGVRYAPSEFAEAIRSIG